MHPGLASLASDEPPAAGAFKSLVASAKRLFANRAAAQLQLGRLTILTRTFLSPTSFSQPADRTEWLQRVRHNVSHYKSVYMIICAAVLVYTGACRAHAFQRTQARPTVASSRAPPLRRRDTDQLAGADRSAVVALGADWPWTPRGRLALLLRAHQPRLAARDRGL